MQVLRANTAAVFKFGPFVSPSDGVTLVSTLVAAMDGATTGIRISKNGGAWADRSATITATTYAEGWYAVTLNATDTNTPGRLTVKYNAAGTNLPVSKEFQVVKEGIYDSLYGAYPSVITGTCDATGSTFTAATSLEGTYSVTDSLVGRVLIYDGNTTAALRGQAGTITAYNGTSGLITFASGTFTTASANGDTFKIY
jgi:hypothetical protein